jgi:hypothetical protein
MVWALNRSDMLPKHWSSNTQKTLGLGVHLRPMAHSRHSHRSFWFFLRHSASCLFQSLEHHWQALCVTVIVGVFPCFSRSPRAFWVAFLRAQRNSTTKKRGLSKKCWQCPSCIRSFEPRGLPCSVTKPQLPADHTLYTFLPASALSDLGPNLPGFQHISTTNTGWKV